jgi:hypothetical protein
MIALLGASAANYASDIPEIIKAAAQSELGIFALMIIALSLLAWTFFRRANQYVGFFQAG